MASLVKLKQIESGAGIQSAITLAHPAATLTNNAAPFAFDVSTQVGNISQVGTVSVAGNTLTYTPGDGTPPVTYAPTFAADVFIQSGAYNSTTGNLELTLNDATTVTVPLSDLVPIATADSQTIDFSGDGTNANPVTGQVIFSAASGNLSTNDGTGVFTSVATTAGNGTTISGNGTAGSPFAVAVTPDPAPGNALTVTAAGVYVPATPNCAHRHSQHTIILTAVAPAYSFFNGIQHNGISDSGYQFFVNGVEYTSGEDYQILSGVGPATGFVIEWTSSLFNLEVGDYLRFEVATNGCDLTNTNT